MSCCFRGASWFRKCGKPPKFKYTWAQGMKVCKGKPADNNILIRELAEQIEYGLSEQVSLCLEQLLTIALRYSIINNTLSRALST